MGLGAMFQIKDEKGGAREGEQFREKDLV